MKFLPLITALVASAATAITSSRYSGDRPTASKAKRSDRAPSAGHGHPALMSQPESQGERHMNQIQKMLLAGTTVVLVALGLFLGFRPVYDAAGYNCGSAFRENPDLLSNQLTDVMTGGTGESSCDKERSDALPLPLVVLAAGVLCGIGSAVVIWPTQKAKRAADADDKEWTPRTRHNS